MTKKCTVCGEQEAKFVIKGTTNYYCEECAQEMFDDITVLQTVEEQANKLKKIVDDDEEQIDEQEKQTEDN